MKKTLEFLKSAGTFYLATIDGDQPRVRPFGVVTEFEGRLYICTANTKACFAQMINNPKVEICAFVDNEWIRLAGEVQVDPRDVARLAVLKDNPRLKSLYSAEDGFFEVLYFTSGTATFASFTEDSTVEEF